MRAEKPDGDGALDLTDNLRNAILRGEYTFGSRLKIDEIARRYGVSHMPVRKALHQLAGERLVTAERNRGASVRSIDTTSVRNIYDVVIPLESLLTRRATERMNRATAAQLLDVEQRFELAAEALDAEAVADLNRAFHEIIGDRAGNPDASHIVNRYQELLRAFRRFYGFDAGRLPGVIADHRSLLASFATGDADGAAAIAAGHAAKARNALIAAIRGPDNDKDNENEETLP
jgi:DNA-binding GntR family transcriptional regulator